MGADRILYRSYIVPKGSDKKLISTQNPDYPTVNDVAADQKCTNSFLYVSLNKELYPGSVFEGTKCLPKEVIYLTDIFSFSSGDLGPNMFTGDIDDGYLGRYVQMNLVGCVDGRFFGGSSFEPFPVNVNTALTLTDGTPVSPFLMTTDFGAFYNAYGKSAVSPYVQHNAIKPVRTPVSGTDGGAALPISFEATVFQDFGLTPMTRAPLPGWTAGQPTFSDPSTWRYLYLEQAIEVAKKPVKFRTKHPKKGSSQPPKCRLANCHKGYSGG